MTMRYANRRIRILSTRYLKNRCSYRITILVIEMFHCESWKPIYFGVNRSNVKVTRHKNIAGVRRGAVVSAGVFCSFCSLFPFICIVDGVSRSCRRTRQLARRSAKLSARTSCSVISTTMNASQSVSPSSVCMA